MNDSQKALQEKRTPCEVWTRVMGYHRPVSSFNRGKKSEHYSRTHFKETVCANSAFCQKYEMKSTDTETYILFTTLTCPNCPAMKAAISDQGIEAMMFDETSPNFHEEAEKYGISTVPTLLKFSSKGELISRISEVSELPKMLTTV